MSRIDRTRHAATPAAAVRGRCAPPSNAEAPMNDRDSNFLSRWSRRKAQVREGMALPERPRLRRRSLPWPRPQPAPHWPCQPCQPRQPPPSPVAAGPAIMQPAPTLTDVAALSPQSGLQPIRGPRGDARGEERRAEEALHRPALQCHGRPGHLHRRLRQARSPAGRHAAQDGAWQVLGLFDDEKTAEAASTCPDAVLDAPNPPEAAAGDSKPPPEA